MTISMTDTIEARKVIIGVDTHKHIHVAVAVDTWGTRLDARSFSADSGGYRQLIAWAEDLGPLETFGIEGTGSYGAGLTSAVRRSGYRVIEVNRGDRRSRRTNGKSDTLDAEAAARTVLSGQSTVVPKTADGHAEMLRQIRSPVTLRSRPGRRRSSRSSRSSSTRRPISVSNSRASATRR